MTRACPVPSRGQRTSAWSSVPESLRRLGSELGKALGLLGFTRLYGAAKCLCLYEHIELQLDTPEPFEHSFISSAMIGAYLRTEQRSVSFPSGLVARPSS